jgi:hypothetical protein
MPVLKARGIAGAVPEPDCLAPVSNKFHAKRGNRRCRSPASLSKLQGSHLDQRFPLAFKLIVLGL